MRKWSFLLILLFALSVVFSVPDDIEPIEATTEALSDGIDPDIPPFEALAETTANIYIYVTLRQPAGPEASVIEIESTYTGPLYDDFVQIKAVSPLYLRDSAEVQFYLLYRSQWAPFTWTDLNVLASYDDSMWIINPIENWVTHVDPTPAYRWYTNAETRDEFQDSVFDKESVWGVGYGGNGISNTTINWFYVCIAVDETPTTTVSPEPSPPVGEVDQNIIQGDNILSIPVDIGVRRYDSLGIAIDTIGIGNNMFEIHTWDPAGATWTRRAWKVGPMIFGTAPCTPGSVFRLVKNSAEPVVWVAAVPGFVPLDSALPVHTLTKPPSDTKGDNFVMMPYQTYNMLLATNSTMSGIDYVRAKDVLQDITTATEVHKWTAGSWTRIAWYMGPIPFGDGRVLPGLPYRIVVTGEVTWPPTY